MRTWMLLGGAILLSPVALISEVRAQETSPAVTEMPPDESSWEFSATAYLWASGLEGEIGALPSLPTVEVDLSFGDVLENLDFAGMLLLQARKDRFVAFADISYVDLGASRDLIVRDPVVLTAKLDTSLFISTVAAGYRAVDQESISLDAVGGVRIMAVDTRLSLSLSNAGVTGQNSETWIDPVVGARLRVPLAERWTMVAYGDVGGFGLSSDVTWQLMAGVQYQIGRQTSLVVGWRHYAVDYENDGFLYDVSLTGPVLGFTLGF